eukprot:GHVU01119899.1.p1 GENE.GHVU01119899.1~~GHVU01119899.1.p1  ORF type:complete len:145 (+),score=7.24 GHVU01119899.1:263-697(+)
MREERIRQGGREPSALFVPAAVVVRTSFLLRTRTHVLPLLRGSRGSSSRLRRSILTFDHLFLDSPNINRAAGPRARRTAAEVDRTERKNILINVRLCFTIHLALREDVCVRERYSVMVACCTHSLLMYDASVARQPATPTALTE